MLFGAPAQPMEVKRSAAIAKAVALVPNIVEAHLPQCYMEGLGEPRQVLVLGVRAKEDIPRIMEQLAPAINRVMPDGEFLDMIPFHTASIPAGVRESGCEILRAPKRPWWKLW